MATLERRTGKSRRGTCFLEPRPGGRSRVPWFVALAVAASLSVLPGACSRTCDSVLPSRAPARLHVPAPAWDTAAMLQASSVRRGGGGPPARSRTLDAARGVSGTLVYHGSSVKLAGEGITVSYGQDRSALEAGAQVIYGAHRVGYGKDVLSDAGSEDLVWSYYGDRVVVDATYYAHTGYSYRSDTDDPVDSHERTDMRSSGVSCDVHYVCSPEKLSLKALLQQTGLQLSSGGSALLMVSLSTSRISGDYSLVPVQHQAAFGELADLRDVSFACLNVGLGYAYCHARGGGRYSLYSLELGVGLARYDLDAGAETAEGLGFSSPLAVRAAWGRQCERYFYAYGGGGHGRASYIGEVRVQAVYLTGEFCVGVRF